MWFLRCVLVCIWLYLPTCCRTENVFLAGVMVVCFGDLGSGSDHTEQGDST